jgi:hypothetical protein
MGCVRKLLNANNGAAHRRTNTHKRADEANIFTRRNSQAKALTIVPDSA